MSLSIAIDHPDLVLGKGTHAGHDWVVTNNGMGFRCGYVRVGKGHPWHGKDYDDVDADCHGGLTFSKAGVDCGRGKADDGWWLGFDAAHFMDAPDTKLPSRLESPVFFREFREGIVRSQKYMENQCRQLCEQAAEAGVA